MEGYLEQITERGNEHDLAELMPVTIGHRESSARMGDPFETNPSNKMVEKQVVPLMNESVSPLAQIIEPAAGPRSIETKNILHETSQFTRYFIRMNEQQTDEVAGKEHKNVFPSAAEEANRPAQFFLQSPDVSAGPENIKPEKPAGDQNPEPRKKWNAEALFQSEKKVQYSKNASSDGFDFPRLMPATINEKQTWPVKPTESLPRLTIGRITVEVIPAEKQKVVHTVEQRIIRETRTGEGGSGKYIFGLGQY